MSTVVEEEDCDWGTESQTPRDTASQPQPLAVAPPRPPLGTGALPQPASFQLQNPIFSHQQQLQQQPSPGGFRAARAPSVSVSAPLSLLGYDNTPTAAVAASSAAPATAAGVGLLQGGGGSSSSSSSTRQLAAGSLRYFSTVVEENVWGESGEGWGGGSAAPGGGAPLPLPISFAPGSPLDLALQARVPGRRKKLHRPAVVKRLAVGDAEFQRQQATKALGKTIDKAHALYQLSYGMMMGIFFCSLISKGELDVSQGKLHLDDLMAVRKVVFLPKGSLTYPQLPPHPLPKAFKFKDYAPNVFHSLRERFSINHEEYLHSLGGACEYIEFASNSKSGSFFFFSNDGRFMIKTQSKRESKFLRRMMAHYYQHVMTNPHTYLIRFYGMHRIKMPHLGRTVYFVVMQSVFYGSVGMSEIYDLKGSTIGRAATAKEKASSRPVLKDMDLLSAQPARHIHLGAERRGAFLAQLAADAKFLERMEIMDYSLLLGIAQVKRGGGGEGVTSMPSSPLPGGGGEGAASPLAPTSADSAAAGGSSSSSSSSSLAVGAPDGTGLPPIAPARRSNWSLPTFIYMQGSAAAGAAAGAGDAAPTPLSAAGVGLATRSERALEAAGSSSESSSNSNSSSSSSSSNSSDSSDSSSSSSSSSSGSSSPPSSLHVHNSRAALSALPASVGAAIGALGRVGLPPLHNTPSARAARRGRGEGAAPASDLEEEEKEEGELEEGEGLEGGEELGRGGFHGRVFGVSLADAGGPGSAKPEALPPGAEAPSMQLLFQDSPLKVARHAETGAALPPAPFDYPAAAGGVPGTDAEGMFNGELYFMGVIDILQQYTLKKRAENFFKSMVNPPGAISSVSPAFYASRFVEFVAAATK